MADDLSGDKTSSTRSKKALVRRVYVIKHYAFGAIVLMIIALVGTHLCYVNNLWPGNVRVYYDVYKVGSIIVWVGQMKSKEQGYYDSSGAWVIDGYHRTWNTKGVLSHEAWGRKGMVVGTMTTWDEYGRLEKTVEFESDGDKPRFNQARWDECKKPAYGVVKYYRLGKVYREEVYHEGIMIRKEER